MKIRTGKTKAIGLQLYSIRELMEVDPAGTLQKVAEIGFKELEYFPGEKGDFYGISAKEFKKLLDDHSLRLISSHKEY